MEMDEAVTRMAALAAPSRLRALRILAECGDEGLASGELARRLGLTPSTVSTQLLQLSHARLVKVRHDKRSVIYRVDLESVKELMVYLADDCTAGRITATIKLPKKPHG